jgi:hypothetical protein
MLTVHGGPGNRRRRWPAFKVSFLGDGPTSAALSSSESRRRFCGAGELSRDASVMTVSPVEESLHRQELEKLRRQRSALFHKTETRFQGLPAVLGRRQHEACSSSLPIHNLLKCLGLHGRILSSSTLQSLLVRGPWE